MLVRLCCNLVCILCTQLSIEYRLVNTKHPVYVWVCAKYFGIPNVAVSILPANTTLIQLMHGEETSNYSILHFIIGTEKITVYLWGVLSILRIFQVAVRVLPNNAGDEEGTGTGET